MTNGLIIKLFITYLGLIPFTSCAQSPTSNREIKNVQIMFERGSPTWVLQAFTYAKKAKNTAAMKEALSKSTLNSIKEVAAAKGQSIDEYLASGNTTPLNHPDMPQTRDEIIQNDIATVEIRRFSNDKWRKLTFVKEDGKWKIDLNKFLDELYPSLQNQDSADAPPPKRP